ncbi:MAG: helix-turn-helix domain-containing protein, partial [Acidobacteriaceae bacterium]|nr:helix-turn-helix domain-containing protein [Acidobacteriaceae bacterium]
PKGIDFRGASEKQIPPLRCGMTNKRLRNDKQQAQLQSQKSYMSIRPSTQTPQTERRRKSAESVIQSPSINSSVVSIADQIERQLSLLTPAQLAEFLALKPKTLYAKVARGSIPSVRLDGCIRFDPMTTARWLCARAA